MCATTPGEQRAGGEEDDENTGLVISFWAMFAEGRLQEVQSRVFVHDEKVAACTIRDALRWRADRERPLGRARTVTEDSVHCSSPSCVY